MRWCIVLGVLLGAVYTYGQQYGPLLPRPVFAGAQLVQPARPAIRRPSGPPRGVPEGVTFIQASPGHIESPQARLRRPQPLARARAQPFSVPQGLEPQRSNLVDEERPAGLQQFTKGRITGPTPLPPLPQQQTTKLLTPRPVIEDEEEDEDSESTLTTPGGTAIPASVRSSSFTPSLSSPLPVGFQRPQHLQPSAFRPSPPAQPIGVPESGTLQARQLKPQQVRPIQLPNAAINRQVIQAQHSEEEEEDDEPQYYRPQSRPLQKKAPEPAPQQILDHQYRPQPIRQQQQQQQQQQSTRQQPLRAQNDYNRPPQPKQPHAKPEDETQRRRKPVVQTVKKYHEENEDGSITWGYENDDGTFKEETIGVDCVTRGKYGYYDPDGVKREYSYQTGIPCDKEAEAEAAASVADGFIDYTNNKYVLPNGDEIDLEAMVKNRARKPVHAYRN